MRLMSRHDYMGLADFLSFIFFDFIMFYQRKGNGKKKICLKGGNVVLGSLKPPFHSCPPSPPKNPKSKIERESER